MTTRVVPVESETSGTTLKDNYEMLKRELGLEGTVSEVVTQACRELGVPLEGPVLGRAARCRAQLFGGATDVSALPVGTIQRLTNETLRAWVARWRRGDRAGLPPIESWDTSAVTDMSRLFFDKQKFNEDISAWDVGRVTNMDDLFSSCSSFNDDIDSWDVRQVTSMEVSRCRPPPESTRAVCLGSSPPMFRIVARPCSKTRPPSTSA